MSEFPAGTRVRVVKYGSGCGFDAAHQGKTGTVVESVGYTRYVEVKVDGASSASINSALPCLPDELERLA